MDSLLAIFFACGKCYRSSARYLTVRSVTQCKCNCNISEQRIRGVVRFLLPLDFYSKDFI